MTPAFVEQFMGRLMQESDLTAAAKVWNDPNESLDSINRRIHDGVPLESLADRGRSYVDHIFDLFPYARPKDGAAVMEIGSGVGYIMEAMHEGARSRGMTLSKVIGLDIAEHMLERAKRRLCGNRVFSFLHYNGTFIPLHDRSLDLIYSVASLQHVPRPYVFNLFFEILRLLKPDGYAVIQLLGVKQLYRQPHGGAQWRAEISNQVSQAAVHWHHYYSAEELACVISATGFGHFDIRDGELIWVLAQPAKLSLPSGFDPQAYLALNQDVAQAACDPEAHWLCYGYRESRRWSYPDRRR